MRERRILGVAPTVFLLGMVSLLNDVSSDMLHPLLPVFLASLGASTAFIGMVDGLAETASSLLKLASGWMADRFGRRRLFACGGYVLSNVARPLTGVATAGWHVLLFRFADRSGKGLRSAPRDAIIADVTPASARGRAFGLHRAMDHAGALLGALAAFALMSFVGASMRSVFLLSAVPGALATGLILAGIGLRRDPPHERVPPPRLSLAPFDRRFRYLLATLGLFAMANSSDSFLLLRARDVGIPVASLPLVSVLLHAVKSLASTPGGIVSDRLGRVPLLAGGWLVYSAVYVGFASAGSAREAWLLFAAYGVFHGLTEGAERAVIADFAPAELRGTAFGLYHFVAGLAALPASLLCGWLWQAWSPAAALGTSGALAAAAAAALIALRGPRSPQSNTTVRLA
jgi:MFS family permease